MPEPAKVFEDRLTPGDWRVEWEDEDGGVEVTIFSGRMREIGRFITPAGDIANSLSYHSAAGEIHTRPADDPRQRRRGPRAADRLV
jgi:hypothetical protein